MATDFGPKHLIGLAWLFSLIAILLVTLLTIRKKRALGESFDKAVIRYTCYFMWAWEIVKTIKMVNDGSGQFGEVGHYPIWMAPFHICSMALYAFAIVGSKRESKLQEWVKPFAFAVMLAVTMIILIIPASSGILGAENNWTFTPDNLLPFQSWFYHGCLVFVPLYMVLSGFYRPKFSDIYKGATVLCIVAAGAQILNYTFDGGPVYGPDFMTLRYGRGNPLYALLGGQTIQYYVVLAVAVIGVMSLIITIAILCNKLADKKKAKSINK